MNLEEENKETLKESIEIYKAFFENTPDGFEINEAIFDDNGKLCDIVTLRVNNSWEHVTGLKKEKVLGKRISKVMPGLEPSWYSYFAKVAEKGQSIYFENYDHYAGKWYDVSAFPLKNNQFGVLFRDITKRKEIEEQLKNSEEKYRALFENMPQAFALFEVIFDRKNKPADFHCLEINEGFAKLFKLSKEFAVGKRAYEVFPNLSKSYLELLGKVAVTGKPLQIERYGKTINRWVEVFAYSPKKGQVVTIVTDRTQRKEAEERIKKYTEELEAFSYSVSHDLRAPLRSIDGFSQLILNEHKDKLDDEGKKYFERIRRSSQKLSFLLDDIQRLFKVTSSEFKRKDLDLSKIVSGIAKNLKEHYPERKVQFKIENDIKAKGDEELLKIALTNLLENAFKFTSNKENAVIEFGTLIKNRGTGYFVRDNGIGFDKQISGKLFAPFRRFHEDEAIPGTGIGLSIVERVIKRHGGKVWAEGEKGNGATFYFTLDTYK